MRVAIEIDDGPARLSLNGVMRALTKMYEFISSFEGAYEVFVSIVNKNGLYRDTTFTIVFPLW